MLSRRPFSAQKETKEREEEGEEGEEETKLEFSLKFGKFLEINSLDMLSNCDTDTGGTLKNIFACFSSSSHCEFTNFASSIVNGGET